MGIKEATIGIGATLVSKYMQAKAWSLKNLDTGEVIVGQFPAESPTRDVGANWSEVSSLNRQFPISSFLSGKSDTFNVPSRFFRRDMLDESPIDKIETLISWCRVDTKFRRPPILRLVIGAGFNDQSDSPANQLTGALVGGGAGFQADVYLTGVGGITYGSPNNLGGIIDVRFTLGFRAYKKFSPQEAVATDTRYARARDTDYYESLAWEEYQNPMLGDVVRKLPEHERQLLLKPGDIVKLPSVEGVRTKRPEPTSAILKTAFGRKNTPQKALYQETLARLARSRMAYWYDAPTGGNASIGGSTNILGHAMSFNGVDTRVEVPVPGPDDNTRYGFGFWFRSVDQGSNYILGRTVADGTTGWGILMNEGRIRFQMLANSINGVIVETGSATYNDGDWHYCVVNWAGTSNAAGVQIYMDGELATTFTRMDTLSLNPTPGAFDKTTLGARSGGKQHWAGRVAAFTVWSDVLSANDVQKTYAGRSLVNMATMVPLEDDDTIVFCTYGPLNIDVLEGGQVKDLGPIDNWGTTFNMTNAANLVEITTSEWTPVPKGRCIRFTGSTFVRVIGVTDINFERTNTFSLGFWIRSWRKNWFHIAGKTSGANFKGYSVSVNPFGQVQLSINGTDPDGFNATFNMEIHDGKWHFVVLTFDGTNSPNGILGYKDGASVAVANTFGAGFASSAQTTGTDYLGLGAAGGTGVSGVGTKDQVDLMQGAVWNIKLSAAQVTANYAARSLPNLTTIPGTGSLANLKEYLPIGETDTPATVSNLAGFDGTLINGVASDFDTVSEKELAALSSSLPWNRVSGCIGWWDSMRNVTLSTTLNASGAAPPAVTLGGNLNTCVALRMEVTTAGTLGVAVFRWQVNGGAWTEGVATAATVSLGLTGLVANFPAANYFLGNTYQTQAASVKDCLSGQVAQQATTANQPLYIYSPEMGRNVFNNGGTNVRRLVVAAGGLSGDASHSLFFKLQHLGSSGNGRGWGAIGTLNTANANSIVGAEVETVNYGSYSATIVSGSALTANRVYRVGKTRLGGGSTQGYLNGIADGSPNATAVALSASGFVIGAAADVNGRAGTGNIGIMCAYNKQLSASELETLDGMLAVA